ncbi:hypothetical protein wVul_0032 [Wolbachia endosymbiont of Armadillidium vulgare str. wVulC]|nr:hypothetical protein wVul_0032 [Wolbachia endosymbiont of Armadillidium vulgare str. wVulC]
MVCTTLYFEFSVLFSFIPVSRTGMTKKAPWNDRYYNKKLNNLK